MWRLTIFCAYVGFMCAAKTNFTLLKYLYAQITQSGLGEAQERERGDSSPPPGSPKSRGLFGVEIKPLGFLAHRVRARFYGIVVRFSVANMPMLAGIM